MEEDEYYRNLAAISAWPEYDIVGIIDFYVMFINRNEVPPHNLLKVIGDRFNDYLEADGAKTLDEAFNLVPKKGVGHPLKQKRERQLKGHIRILVWQLIQEKGLSVSKAIEEVLNEFPKIKYHVPALETLEREYSALNSDKFFKSIAEVDPDRIKLMLKLAREYLISY